MIFRNFRLSVFVAVVTLASIGACLITNPASAYERKNVHLQVSPTKQTVKLTPGETYTGTFKVQNVGLKKFKYKVYATPYSVTSDNYDLTYTQKNNYTQIAEWITFDKKQGTLESETDIDITYTIKVPKDVPAGGQYAALMAETDDSNGSNNSVVKTTSRVGTVIYGHVAGQTRKSANVISNNLPGFLFSGPLSATSLIENTGNIDGDASYTVRIKPIISNEYIFDNQDKPDTRKILPGTRRFNTVSWTNVPTFGIYNAEQTIKIFGKVVSTENKLVIVCPIWIIIIIAFVIFASIFWIVSRARSRQNPSKSN